MQTILSPRQLARAIGVSESSLKRWVDDGAIEALRTAGGHRRIHLHEAVRFIRTQKFTLVDPAALGLPELQSLFAARSAADAVADDALLFSLLQSGQALKVQALLLNWYLAGRSIPAIADGPFRAAMARIGELWPQAPEGIFLEHRATDICAQSLHFLRALIPVPGLEAPLAIGGALSGDPYLLPALLAAATVQEVGYRTVNLGPDTPLETLLLAARTEQARLVFLSLSHPLPPDFYAQILTPLAQQLSTQGIALDIGGRSLDPAWIPPTPDVHFSTSLSEFATFTRSLLD